jgi:hypothetical protein
MNGIRALINGSPDCSNSSFSCEDARGWQSAALPNTQSCWHPDLRLPASRTGVNKFVLLKSPSLTALCDSTQTKTKIAGLS